MTHMIVKGAVLAAAVFALASCNEEDENEGTAATTETTQTATPAKPGREKNFTTLEFALRTATGRELMVTARADCRVSAGASCATAIGDKLQRQGSHEKSWQRVESLLPVASAAIRTHALFTEEMMGRALTGGYKADLYTVTAVKDCATGQPVSTVVYTRSTTNTAPPAEEPKAVAAIGTITGGKCVFQ